MEELVVFSFPYQTNGNHATGLSTVGHVISEQHWKSIFDFTEIVNNFVLKPGAIYQIAYLFPTFLWNYTYNFENIFTAWS